MKRTAAFATTAGACAFVATALAAPALAMGFLNGPSLEGQEVILPDGRSIQIVAEEFQGRSWNGPTLDGQKVALPAGLVDVPGTPAEDEYQGKGMNGPALNGQKVALPDGQVLERS